MKHGNFFVAYFALSALAASPVGCAADTDSENPQAEDAVKATDRSKAVKLFLSDSKIKSQLAGKKHPEPVALLLDPAKALGLPAPEYLVVTYYDNTPPGLMDASITKTVAATVRFAPGGVTASVKSVSLVNAEKEGRLSSVAGEQSAKTAMAAYLKDSRVKNELQGKGSPPEAALTSRGTSLAGPVSSFLVVSLVDKTPPGMMDAQLIHPVLATVSFGPGQIARVTLAEIKR